MARLCPCNQSRSSESRGINVAVDVSLNQAANLLVVKISGVTDAQTVADAYAQAVASPEHKQNMNAMWDITGTKLSQYSIGEVRELARLIGQYSKQRGKDYKVAMVTNNRGDYHLLNVYSTFFRLAGSFRMRVFRDPQLAQDWIETEG